MQPLTKEQQLHNDLTSLLSSGEVINEIKMAQYLREIDSNTSGANKLYLKALSYAAARKKEKAKEYFEQSLPGGEAIFYANYLAFIDDFGSFPEWKRLAEMASDTFPSVKSFARSSFEGCLFCCDLSGANYFLSRYTKLCGQDDEDMMSMVSNYQEREDYIESFLDRAQFNDSTRGMLVGAILDVLSPKNLNIKSVRFFTGSAHDPHLNLYELTLDTEDVDLLTDANMALSYKLAEHDELLGKNFSVWLSGREGE